MHICILLTFNVIPLISRKRSMGEGDGCKRCNCKKTKCLKLYVVWIIYLLSSLYTLYRCIVFTHPTKLLLLDTVIALLLDTTALKLVLAKGALTALNTRILFLTLGRKSCLAIRLHLYPRPYSMRVSPLQVIFRYGTLYA